MAGSGSAAVTTKQRPGVRGEACGDLGKQCREHQAQQGQGSDWEQSQCGGGSKEAAVFGGGAPGRVAGGGDLQVKGSGSGKNKRWPGRTLTLFSVT